MRIIPVFLRQVFDTCDIQCRTDTGGIKLHDRIYSNLAALPLPVDPGKQYAEQIPPCKLLFNRSLYLIFIDIGTKLYHIQFRRRNVVIIPPSYSPIQKNE